MLSNLGFLTFALAATGAPHATDSLTPTYVSVDTTPHAIVITVGPARLPASSYGYSQVEDVRRVIEWPATGWVRGYRVEVIDQQGNPLPRSIIHHAGLANLDRRTLAYSMAERIIAVGAETEDVRLHSSIGMPLEAGHRLSLYYALYNPTGENIEGAYLRIHIDWTAAGARTKPRSVLPLYLDAQPDPGGTSSFDILPGRSTRSSEFTLAVGGRLLAAGGHLHDYGTAIRLEDAASGKVLVRLKAKRDDQGRVSGVARKVFVSLFNRKGLRLEAGRTYRVVGEYDNPSGETVRAGAMAMLGGAFAPDDLGARLAADPNDLLLQRDIAALRGDGPAKGHTHHGAPNHHHVP